MKGLLYKDLTTIVNSYKKNALLVVVLYGAMGLFSNMSFMLYALVFLFGMYPLSSLSFDEYSHWDIYTRTLPVAPGAVVAVKYLLGLGFMAGSALLSMALLAVQNTLQGGGLAGLGGHLCGCLAALALVLLYYGVSFPLSYQFGAAKARSWVLAVFAAVFCAICLVVFFADTPAGSDGWLAQLSAVSDREVLGFTGLMALLGLAVYGASWWISTAIYRAKEF